MSFTPTEAADLVVERASATKPGALAVAVLAGGSVALKMVPGADEVTEDTFFDIGSVTKTMTGLLLADCVVREEASPETTVGDVLGAEAGNCAGVTVMDLVTHQSGLPRLPPNLDLATVDPKDPYASYTEEKLIEALGRLPQPVRGFAYSNFGFMLLGILLRRITGNSLNDLLRDRIFDPLGMAKAICGIPPKEGRMPGYAQGEPTPWWRIHVPGFSGVAASIRDVARYLEGHLRPPDELADSIELALRVHYEGPQVMGMGWVHMGGGHWHNGGTGGFHSFVAIHRGTQTGIALLANAKETDFIERVGVEVLTQLVRARP